jgi:hypothetical protein
MTRPLRLAQKIYADGSKLTATDLLNKEDFERERANLLQLARQHRSQRRVRLNPSLSVIFETRFTAWLQIQEELRWLSHPSPQDVAEVLTRCNLLAPKPYELTATLFVDGGDNPASLYWIECIAANAFSVSLRLSGRVLRGCSQESSGGVLAAVHTFIFQPTARCGPATEIIWGDSTEQHATPVSAMTRHALAQDLNPASNRNCFVVPAAVRGTATRPAYAAAGIGPPGLALPNYPPLRVVMAPEPETGGDSP